MPPNKELATLSPAMTTHPADWSSPPRYDEDSASTRNDNTSDTVLKSKKPASTPRYVYYRLYAPDGMLACKKHDQNRFIGRIKATSVPPPHTVASLKRALVQAEELPDPDGDLTQLFLATEAKAAMVPSARVDIMNGNIGATSQTPMALVFLINPQPSLQVLDDNDETLPTVYYRLYNSGGEESSLRSFEADEPALGRVERESIAPPRSALSVKRRIAKVEGKSIYRLADLFTDVTADQARPSDSLVDQTCGSSTMNPIMFVLPGHRSGVYNRSTQIAALHPNVNPSNILGVNKALPEGIYSVTNSRRSVVMELAHGGSANGTPVQAWANAGPADMANLNQLWLVQLTSSGYYSFRNLRGGTYMELCGGNSANHTEMFGYESQGLNGGTSANQEWEVIQAEGFYKIRNRKSQTYVNLSGGGSSNGTQIMGFADTTGTSGEQDELWKFTLRSVTLSDVLTALEESKHRFDDMLIVSKDRFFYIPDRALLANIWRDSSLVSQLRNSVFSDQAELVLAFKAEVVSWAAQNIKADNISLLCGFICPEGNSEACNWTFNQEHSCMLFLSPMNGSPVAYGNEHSSSSWGFF
ncbi:hypothetical protein DFH07DRAFT_786576 [Mycena maculata]|uniref:Ricin B lectin domain-containing protein n=1 Tax=Mycena maculata TaxID=230809 RepID=A0AAD7KHT7_9AGAR|nr:hypothetical protein DFH07DRAFT_786576 [Mycena maculata]